MTSSVEQLVEQAQLAQRAGELDRAESLYSDARARALADEDVRLAAMIARSLGVISLMRGDHDQTLRHYRTSLDEFRTIGAAKHVLTALSDTAMLCTDLQRWDDAVSAFEEAVGIADALGDIPEREAGHERQTRSVDVAIQPDASHHTSLGPATRDQHATHGLA